MFRKNKKQTGCRDCTVGQIHNVWHSCQSKIYGHYCTLMQSSTVICRRSPPTDTIKNLTSQNFKLINFFLTKRFLFSKLLLTTFCFQGATKLCGYVCNAPTHVFLFGFQWKLCIFLISVLMPTGCGGKLSEQKTWLISNNGKKTHNTVSAKQRTVQDLTLSLNWHIHWTALIWARKLLRRGKKGSIVIRIAAGLFFISIIGNGWRVSKLFHLYWFFATSSQVNGPRWILLVLQMVSLLCNSALQQINMDQVDAEGERHISFIDAGHLKCFWS